MKNIKNFTEFSKLNEYINVPEKFNKDDIDAHIKSLKEFKKEFKKDIELYLDEKTNTGDFKKLIGFFKTVKPTVARKFITGLKKHDFLLYEILKERKMNEGFMDSIKSFVDKVGKGGKWLLSKLKGAWQYLDEGAEELANDVTVIENKIKDIVKTLMDSYKNKETSKEAIEHVKKEIYKSSNQIISKYVKMIELEISVFEKIEVSK